MANNNFKPFGIGNGANVTSQADYEALAALLTGFTSGKASSSQINKAIRQATVMASILAQFISDSSGNDVLDNGDTQTIMNNLLLALENNGNENFLQIGNNLSEINAAGTVAQASARTAISAAALIGLASQVFSVATATANAHAVPLLQMNTALALKAALAGLATQVFSVATATANAHAVPLLQMNTALGLKASISSFSPGSNGNGVYYSLPGGLQICRGNITIQANASATWTYPLAFSSAPQVFYTALIPAGSGTPSAMWINSIAAGSVSIYNPNGQATQINLLGIL